MIIKDVVVAVCGNIACGKTSLVRILNDCWEPRYIRYERPEENPFFPEAGNGDPRYFFPSQMWFLLRSAEALHTAHRSGNLALVERIPGENCIFARTMLSSSDYEVYHQCYDILVRCVEPPTAIVYMRAGLNTLLRRSALRQERLQDTRYFRDLMRMLIPGYEEFYEKCVRTSQHFVIDSDTCDFVTSESDRELLLKELSEWISKDVVARARE